jgi:CTP synthase
VTWLPHINATNELKTKPTQHSVRELRSIGISPDMIIARSDHPVEKGIRGKVALFCDVEEEAVIPMVTTPTLYEVPLLLENENVGDYILKRFDIQPRRRPDWGVWKNLVEKIRLSKPSVKFAIVGKYVELHDAYMSVREALMHAALQLGIEPELKWVHSVDLEKNQGLELISDVNGIIVPGGFGSRGIEGKIQAAKFARTEKVPYLGLCLGMQLMVVDFARHVLNSENTNSTEFNPTTEHPVIDLMPDQKEITDMGGTMRLGLYPCHLQPGTIAANAYQQEAVNERHRHRFEFNNQYRKILSEHGMQYSGLSPDEQLVEIAELANHPFMVGTQFHPEFLSRPNQPHPLFLGFVQAACERAKVNYNHDHLEKIKEKP